MLSIFGSISGFHLTLIIMQSSWVSQNEVRSPSEVTICKLSDSLLDREECDIETLLQKKYSTEERKLLIVDRSKGKIIDSRYQDV